LRGEILENTSTEDVFYDGFVATSSDATATTDSGDTSFYLSVPATVDAAIYDTSTNQHLYNIELLLLVVVVLLLCDVVHRLFRSMFNNLLK
jgi:hypothetical protein